MLNDIKYTFHHDQTYPEKEVYKSMEEMPRNTKLVNRTRMARDVFHIYL